MIYYLPLIYYHFSKILSEHLQCTQPYATHHTGVREARGWSQAPKSCLSPAEMLANWQLDKIDLIFTYDWLSLYAGHCVGKTNLKSRICPHLSEREFSTAFAR